MVPEEVRCSAAVQQAYCAMAPRLKAPCRRLAARSSADISPSPSKPPHLVDVLRCEGVALLLLLRVVQRVGTKLEQLRDALAVLLRVAP